MPRHAVLLSALALMLAGCAQPGAKTATKTAGANSAPDSGVYCEREMATGSHMAKRVCRTAEQREASRRATQDALQSSGRGVAKTPAVAN